MRSLLLAVLLLLLSSGLWALEGRIVLAATGEPVANAEVTILGRTGAALTDAEGRFTLQPDPMVPFEILVILPGERYMKPGRINSAGGAARGSDIALGRGVGDGHGGRRDRNRLLYQGR